MMPWSKGHDALVFATSKLTQRLMAPTGTSSPSEAPPEVTLASYRAAATARSLLALGSPSPGSLSTLSVSPPSSQRTSTSTARPSIFNDGASGASLPSNEDVQQPEVFEESDAEDAEGYPDDNSAASEAEEFELLASNTDEVLGCRFLFAKECECEDEEGEDRLHKTRLEGKHKFVLQQGLDEDVSVKEIPKDWVVPDVDVEAREPEFHTVDNPGQWPRYVFGPKFTGSKVRNNKQYKHHALPSGARVHPINRLLEPRRVTDGWGFHYQAVNKIGDGTARGGATTENLIPESRKGSLDAEVLKRCGLSGARMVNEDALFWFQLLLPIGDPAKSGIENDPRVGFYSDSVLYTDIYRAASGIGGAYGHKTNPVELPELVRFHGALIRD